MVQFLWNEQVAEFAVGTSMGRGNRPKEWEENGGGEDSQLSTRSLLASKPGPRRNWPAAHNCVIHAMVSHVAGQSQLVAKQVCFTFVSREW